MRKPWMLVLLLFAPALFALATYEVRSAQHILTVDVAGEGESREYTVRVTDAASGALLGIERLREGGRAQIDAGDRTIRVHVRQSGTNLTATLLVQRDGTIIDSVTTSWLARANTAESPGADRSLPADVLRVGGDVKAPVVMHRVEPHFTQEARQARVSGIVIVEAIVDAQGNVRDARVLEPLPFGLDQAALEAVRQWKFRPATLDGRPVDVAFNVTVNFRLAEEAP